VVTQNPSSALRTPAPSRPYTKARPGYGKRSAPDQRPSHPDDFTFLPERERYIAGYVDHLPDGAAMDIKSLAKDLPLYGQMAIGTALRALAVAGHLRHVRCRVETLGQQRWVTLTYWSRTARDNEWWAAHLHAEAACDQAAPPAAAPTGAPPQAPEAPAVTAPAVPRQRTPGPLPEPGGTPSPAYLALAGLGRTDPRLALSAADCAALEEAAAAWFNHGVSTDYFTRALTSGLPDQVGSPVGFVRRRLVDKLPPRLSAAPEPAAPGAPVRRLLVECASCGRPGPAEALPDGLCRPCRETSPEAAPTPAEPAEPAAERDIQAHMSALRESLRMP